MTTQALRSLTPIALAAVLGAAVAMPASAQNNGLYIQGDVGSSALEFDDGERFRTSDLYRDLKDNYDESGLMPRLSLGYRSGNWRFAADYTLYRKIDESTDNSNANIGAKIKAGGLGFSVMYDFLEGSALRPYVGARIGVNQLKYDVHASVLGVSDSQSEDKTKVGYGAMAGLGLELGDHWTADLGYRYNQLNSDLDVHEVTVGLRLTF